jgi:hypothetical protein
MTTTSRALELAKVEPNGELPRRETQQPDPLLDHDTDAMLARKGRGTGAVLAYRGHLLTDATPPC